jgi:uncharacterized protein
MKKLIILLSIIFLAISCNAKTETPTANVLGNTEQVQTVEQNAKEVHPVSLQALMEKEFDGQDLALGKVLEDNAIYTRYYITYKSGELAISGIMNVPKGNPPEGGWPVLFLNHGHIDTEIYTNGRGLRREQDYFARNGFAVLHSDYRNHAESDDDPNSDSNFRLGYTEDVINAVLAVQKSEIPNISKTQFGMLGHSMGGGITQNVLVVKPGLVKAAVLYAPVSSRQSDNFERWTLGTRQVSEKIMSTYKAPSEEVCEKLTTSILQRFAKEENYLQNVLTWCAGEKDMEFWNNLSAETFFENITEPMLYFHGTSDDSVPIEWSRMSVQTLQGIKKDAQLIEYFSQPHEFTPPTWNDFMAKSAEFFKNHLK